MKSFLKAIFGVACSSILWVLFVYYPHKYPELAAEIVYLFLSAPEDRNTYQISIFVSTTVLGLYLSFIITGIKCILDIFKEFL